MIAIDSVRTSPNTVKGLMVWSLLPCVAMWAGLYEFKSAAWAYVFYHGLCLLPALVWGRHLWMSTCHTPKRKHCLWLLLASVVFSIIALLTYELMGPMLLSDSNVITLLKDLGYSRGIFLALGFYTIVVNPLVEEIFWRGIVLNALDKVRKPPFKHFGIVCSSLAYAAFHYFIFRMVLFPGWAEVATLLLAVYGAGLAILYRKTGSVLTAAVAHGLLTDMAVIVLILDLYRRYPGLL
jgi:membrane protease YdiL (CAAX protease family)